MCYEVVENAVECVQCGFFFCEQHVSNLRSCPSCRLDPLSVRESRAVRRVVDGYLVKCNFCLQFIRRGDLNVHKNYCPQNPSSLCCGVSGCVYQTNQKEDALRHVMEAHGDKFCKNYFNLTAAGNFLHFFICNTIYKRSKLLIIKAWILTNPSMKNKIKY